MQPPPTKTWRQRLRPWHILVLVLLAFAVSFLAYTWYQSDVTNKELNRN
jgi:type VI protein secretion system component VasF